MVQDDELHNTHTYIHICMHTYILLPFMYKPWSRMTSYIIHIHTYIHANIHAHINVQAMVQDDEFRLYFPCMYVCTHIYMYVGVCNHVYQHL